MELEWLNIVTVLGVLAFGSLVAAFIAYANYKSLGGKG